VTAHPVFTIGHSNHALSRFLHLLRQPGVTAVADVRSAPYSRRNPHFDREALQEALHRHGVAYAFLGRELGARPEAEACYEHGHVSFARLAETEAFRAGLERVLRGSERHRIALLCAEAEPLHCHRAILVARPLVQRGARVLHVLGDGRLEAHEETERRLLALAHLAQEELFETPAHRLERAYARQAERIAWARPGPGAHAGARSGAPRG
jgi:uncharacterized protein (DUF488 family)